MSSRNKISALLLAGAAMLTIPFSSFSETVSQKEASRVAQTFFNTLYGEVTAPAKLIWNGKQLTTDRLFSPFYVYNSPKGGFVMVSAENKAYPILAYSRSETFNRERLGEEENDLLKEYARQIELIRYDSRIPTSALHAWQNLPQYLDRIVVNPYATSEFNNLSEEGKERLERIDRRNGWVAMPAAVEFSIYDPSLYRDITLDDLLEERDEEEIPFSFYEDFIAAIRAENYTREAALEELISPSRPVVTSLGGAHFTILFPEPVRMLRVYGLNGALGTEKYFRDTQTVNVDLSALAPGFYAGLVLGESGKIYGFKLYR
ncbi:MAG: Spi family protease inhibitor [Muribaculaceae bacterium]|nr:Spi family protease inhibitor [Muribaculaceae bacterium]